MTDRRRDRGFTLTELLAVVAAIAVVAGMSVPYIIAGLDNMKLGSAVRSLHSELQNARLKAVSTNREMRFRFNCPSAGLYRRVELIGTPAAPDAKDISPDRCNPTTYPYPASDHNMLTLPNNDGAVQYLNSAMTFTVQQTIEFWPDGTAHADAGTGTPWPAIGATPVTITVKYKTKTKSLTVNGVGKIQIQ